MNSATLKSKWANWKFIAFIIILIAIFIKIFLIRDTGENAQVVVELDLEKIAFRSQEEVAAIIGAGKLNSYYRDEKAGCEKCPTLTYKDGKIDIIFINDIADRITINQLSDFSFDDTEILGVLGLKENISPTFHDGNLKRWDNYQKYTQITAFGRHGKLQYILIKCKTP
ncbi:hypothetical protein DYBT9275_05957 [Dyadobacter sp. CECT 9275]|uniref:Uncharacterized protein n=1 Tax=Dyadobacter helix TaxID=2822344 RepID=A0A916JJ46_9BACT|nr:hypothetical protein [Dyadobacter sp. CECT 9275]CAG5018215.1 hypothetical protein DYBT9275_05957 [Dyadobacter sp. CECT 9275]